jgi:hypothetical protein
VLIMAASMALANRAIVYAAALFAQCAFYLLAGYGAWLDSRDARSVSESRVAQVAAWHEGRPVKHAGAANA